MQVTAVLTPAEERGYVAFEPETGTTFRGDTLEEALAALREAVDLYPEDEPMPVAGTPIVTTFTVADRA